MTHNWAVLGASALLAATSYLPYVVYFFIITVMEPHDCFDCFNRIPVLRYSIFQYTLQERNNLRELQIGKGFVERYSAMLREVERKSNVNRSTSIADLAQTSDSAKSKDVPNSLTEQQRLFEHLNQVREELMSPGKRLQLQLAFDEKEIPVSD